MSYNTGKLRQEDHGVPRLYIKESKDKGGSVDKVDKGLARQAW